MLSYPHTPQCCRVYRQIQAYCAMRVSTRVGQQLRELAGATGDIAALPDAILESRLSSGVDRREAARLRELVQSNKRNKRNGQADG